MLVVILIPNIVQKFQHFSAKCMADIHKNKEYEQSWVVIRYN